MPINMSNKMSHTISFGLILVCFLWPVQGFGSVYEDLRNDKEEFRLPVYPPGFLSGPLTPLEETAPKAPSEAFTGEDELSTQFHGEGSRSTSVISLTRLASGNYSLSDLDTLALERNAGIKSAALNVAAARDGYSQVRELNDILLQYTAFTEGLKTSIGPQKGQPMPNTQFPYPGTRQLKSKVVGADVRVARTTLEIRKRDILTRLRKVFWEYVYQHGADHITADVIAQMAHLREVALRKYQTGGTTYYDVVRVDTRLALLKNKRITIRRKIKDLAQVLQTLLNLPEETPIAPPVSVKTVSELPAFETVLRLALDHRQELDLLQARIDRMVFMVQAAETMILPGYSLNFSDFEDRISQAGPDAAP
ncbi:MAG: TolC family protein, partial [Desulfobacterales bacterium]|nr:TolC family protein [Desulfobacterales bacterium]